MIGASTNRATIIVGKSGTGKTTKALELLGNDPIIRYANEYDVSENFTLPVERGILIEEVHIKPKIDLIKDTLLQYKGLIVLTSNNQKDVPKVIMDMCKVKRAGTFSHMRKNLLDLAPNSDDPVEYTMGVFELFFDYLKNQNREEILTKLKFNKPYDELFLTWLVRNMHPSKLAYLDAKVKRKWSQDYFYELLAYSHNGKIAGRIVNPPKSSYSKITSAARKVGLRPQEQHLLKQLKEDESFENHLRRKLNNIERRLLNIEKPKKRRPKKEKQKTLDEWL